MKRLLPKDRFTRNVYLNSRFGYCPGHTKILTRIYLPEEFRVFAISMAVASIGGVIATGSPFFKLCMYDPIMRQGLLQMQHSNNFFDKFNAAEICYPGTYMRITYALVSKYYG